MLEQINRLMHGYVLGPVVCGLAEADFFSLFEQKEVLSEVEILQSLKPNVGHFKAAVRMLESLGWLERDQGQYRLLCSKAMWQRTAKQFLLNLNHTAQLDFAHELFTKEVSQKVWQPLIARSLQARSEKEDAWQDYLDGSWLVPLLISSDQKGCFKDLSAELFTNLPHIQQFLDDYFIAQKWCERTQQGVVSTEMGRYIFERIQLMSTVFSYRSMLSAMPELLFGDAAGVFKRDALGHECHVDRSLNVIGSGFSHQKYFKDLENLIIEIFNHSSLQSQPKAIADTGCGDGSLLKRLYDVILKETLRGQNISEYPLSLVGIDYNQSALDETTKTLDGYPHHALQGDIGDPAQLLKDLKALGFTKDDILHVRSFLDHDRPYQAPEADDYSYHVSDDDSGVYVRADGSFIDSSDMMQSTVEHFRRWQQVVGRHGLINLEVHSLDPRTVHDHLDQTENLHFDAYHAFSSQYLMMADQMIQAAAGGGLWSERSQCVKYPKSLGYGRISLHRFIPQEVSLRHVTLDDVPDLMAIEQACWPKELRSTKSQIKTRIKQYPEGQWGLMAGQKLVGVLTTQKISDPEVLNTALFESVEDLHQQDGSYLQLISMNILPHYQQQGWGDLLRQQALLQASLDSITQAVTGITRCVGFDLKATDYESYIKQEDAQGLPQDSLLAFHVSRGARIVGVVENYRKADEKNQGCGVLIVYDLSNQKSKLKKIAGYSPSKEASLESKIKELLEQALGEKCLSNYEKAMYG